MNWPVNRSRPYYASGQNLTLSTGSEGPLITARPRFDFVALAVDCAPEAAVGWNCRFSRRDRLNRGSYPYRLAAAAEAVLATMLRTNQSGRIAHGVHLPRPPAHR
jgi:hypothetical protein